MSYSKSDLENRVEFLCAYFGWTENTARSNLWAYLNGFSSNNDQENCYLYVSGKYKNQGHYRNSLAKRKHHKNFFKQRAEQLKNQGFETPYKYQLELYTNLGDNTVNNYELRRLKNKHIDNRYQYARILTQSHLKKPEYNLLINLIKTRLNELNKTQLWLAEKLDINISTLRSYVYGFYLPNNDRFYQMLSILDVSYSRVDPILKKRYSEKYSS